MYYILYMHILINIPIQAFLFQQILSEYFIKWAFSLVAQSVKSLPAMQETRVQSLSWDDPLEEEMATHSSILAGKSHGQRRLVGYNPWGHKELDTTEQLCNNNNRY